MTEPALPVPSLATPFERAFPTLTPAQIARIASHGHMGQELAARAYTQAQKFGAQLMIAKVSPVSLYSPHAGR